MHRLGRPTLIAALALAASAPAVAAQSVDATIDRAVAAWNNVKTVRGTFEQTVSNPLTGSGATTRGSFVQARPNRLSIRFDDAGRSAIVSDGSALWIYLPASAPGQVIKRPATDAASAPVDLTGQFLDAPKSKYDIAPAGTRTVAGHPAHGLALVAKKGAGAPFTRATVWVDDDDALIREFESTDPNGVTRHVRLTAIELNPSVERGAFVFSVPRGVRVVDQTTP
jgi:outer membrane lipoprotein carrier protein